MNTYRPTRTSGTWMVALKLLILILGLYLSALVLGKVFVWVFAITFFLIRFIVLLTVSFVVLHLILKLLFRFDLFQFVIGKRFKFH